jgi:phage shock protein A
MSDKYESYIKTLESKIETLQNKINEQSELIHTLQGLLKQSQTDHQINTLLTEIGDDDDRKLFENAMASLNKVNEKIKKRSGIT